MPDHRPVLLAGHPHATDTGVEVHAPWDRRLLAYTCLARAEDAARAVDVAARAFDTTRHLPPRSRASLLAALADTVRANETPLARLLVEEAGKPLCLAHAEVADTAALLEQSAEDALRACAAVGEGGDPVRMRRPMPRGPVLAFCGAEQPLAGVAAIVGPAVAAGCPIVLRPAAATPGAALELGAALVEHGWPPEAISVLPCDEHVAERLVTDRRFGTLVLGRGTPRAAWVAAHLERRHVLAAGLPPVTALIEADADLDRAAEAIGRGAWAHGGQTRAWAQRVLVHVEVWEAFCARFAASAEAFPRGDPAREDVLCGPLLDDRAIDRAQAWILAAEALGGERLAGGAREGSVLTPAALAGEPPFYELLDGAPGGPVAVLEPYPNLPAAIARVNRHPRRGDAALFTRSVAKVWSTFEDLDAATLVHDAHPDGVTPAVPGPALDALLSARVLHIAARDA